MRAYKLQQPDGLIGVLLDPRAPFGDRDDAAMDLAAYDDLRTIEALARVASNPEEDVDLQDSCGESLAEICRRRAHVDETLVARLTPTARRIFTATLTRQ
jgi:hypothetical protein